MVGVHKSGHQCDIGYCGQSEVQEFANVMKTNHIPEEKNKSIGFNYHAHNCPPKDHQTKTGTKQNGSLFDIIQRSKIHAHRLSDNKNIQDFTRRILSSSSLQTT
jgi:hypothetical protein